MIFQKSAAQNRLDSVFVKVDKPVVLIDYINQVENQSKLKFFYLKEWFQSYLVTPAENNLSLREAFHSIFGGTDFSFIYLYDYAVIFFKDPTNEIARDNIVNKAIRDNVEVSNLFLGEIRPITPNEKVKLTGNVVDDQTQSPLPGVLIRVVGSDIGSITTSDGNYELSLSAGEHLIAFKLVNYQEEMLRLTIYQDGFAKINLEEEPTTLEEVVVVDQSIVTKQAGQTSIRIVDVKRAPAFFGEADVVKILQSKTGVTAVSEASTGFNVRGGGADQNLVLFDGTPIFNTSHALGFFSAFNADAVKEASFYKGGIPSEYGGRASSVLSLTSNEGSFEKLNGRMGIGFISGNLTFGGPIKKNINSFNLSLRSTYSDWILKLLNSSYNDVERSSIFFYDGSLKYSSKLAHGGKLTVSSYWSKDRFQLTNDTTNQWQNQAVAIQYYKPVSANLFYYLSVHFGSYQYTVSDKPGLSDFKLKYGVYYPSLKFIMHKDGLHKQTYGFQTTYYNFKPGTLRPVSNGSNTNSITMDNENAIESAIFYGDSFSFGSNFQIDAGLRLSIFNRIGEATVYRYAPGQPLEPRNTLDSTVYKKGDIIKSYFGPEPRLSIRYQVNGISSLKASYNRIYQYVHLISNTASITPVDIWQSSNTYFKPQIADQVSLGYFRNSKNNKWESFIDVYLKHTQNILDFKDGAQLILNPKLETALLTGIGKSYGVELSIEKVKGRLSGNINYTFSRSLRQIAGLTKEEQINNGNFYASNYDQPHIMNVNWRYNLRKRVFFAGSFTYHTGRPISFPLSAYKINEAPIIDFSERNNYRLPDYHRLDLVLIIEGTNKRNKILDGQWIISLYNVYGRKNPYSAFFDYNVSGSVKPYQISLIGVPIPSISYQIKFE